MLEIKKPAVFAKRCFLVNNELTTFSQEYLKQKTEVENNLIIYMYDN